MWHRLAPTVAEKTNQVIAIASGLVNRLDLTTFRSPDRPHLVKCVLVVFDALQGDRSETQQKDDQRCCVHVLVSLSLSLVVALVLGPRSQVGRRLTEQPPSPLEL